MATQEPAPVTQQTQTKITKMELDLSQVTRTKSILNQNQIQKLWNTTPKRNIHMRPGKGGKKWPYPKVGYIRQVLDSVFGFNWDFEIETGLAEAFNVAEKTGYCVVKGILRGRVMVDGQWVEVKKTQFGRNEVKFTGQGADRKPLDFGNDMKGAGSDALKKCASLLGIAGDIYDGEEFIEITITGSDEQKANSKGQKKRLEGAKKALAAESKPVGKQNEGHKSEQAAEPRA